MSLDPPATLEICLKRETEKYFRWFDGDYIIRPISFIHSELERRFSSVGLFVAAVKLPPDNIYFQNQETKFLKTTINMLSKLSDHLGDHVVDKDSGANVFHANSPHALIQASGYLKYMRAKEANKGVFFRGQPQLYPGLQPSLLRGLKPEASNAKRRHILANLLAPFQSDRNKLRAVDPHFHEALLQHYGIRTTWLDVVDNIWIALWFACHNANSVWGPPHYLHFEKRNPEYHSPIGPQYAYILLIESAYFTPLPGHSGHYQDNSSETIDLRVAVPSQYLRPHAQHGILVRRLSTTGKPANDFRPLHIGTIRVSLSAALDWLGSATTLTTHSLFPPVYYDSGYRELLEDVHPEDYILGSIMRIQP